MGFLFGCSLYISKRHQWLRWITLCFLHQARDDCHLGTPLKKHMMNPSSTQQSREFERHNKMAINRWVSKQSRDLKSCAILPLNEFLTQKKSQGKIKEAKQVGRELFMLDHFPTNGSVSTGEIGTRTIRKEKRG